MDNHIRRIGVIVPPGNVAVEREFPLHIPPGSKLVPGAPRGSGASDHSRDNDIWASDLHLTPNGRFLYTAERTSDGRHEVATFDWETGVVLLNDNKTAALELPTFDPLAVLWQFYFAPPEQEEAEFNVATTRRVYHSRFRRVGVETVELPFGEVETQVWERTGGDGNLTARVWLAPSLHHVMVKMRLSNGRITGEALLDSIRVDETVAQR